MSAPLTGGPATVSTTTTPEVQPQDCVPFPRDDSIAISPPMRERASEHTTTMR